jgi:UDP-N-acetyl-2-amino-2-deoxyglucuronate dehydrogenase
LDNGTLNFGIIGCGLISHWHARAIREIHQAKLIGATDINEESLKTFALKYNVFPYESVEEMLRDPQIHVVCICTPSGLHAPLAIQAAHHKKHIIVEKPMALNLHEADEMIKACEKNNVILSVISQLRFSKAMIKIKEIVHKGYTWKTCNGRYLHEILSFSGIL